MALELLASIARADLHASRAWRVPRERRGEEDQYTAVRGAPQEVGGALYLAPHFHLQVAHGDVEVAAEDGLVNVLLVIIADIVELGAMVQSLHVANGCSLVVATTKQLVAFLLQAPSTSLV